jgi:hypothetical protein
LERAFFRKPAKIDYISPIADRRKLEERDKEKREGGSETMNWLNMVWSWWEIA